MEYERKRNELKQETEYYRNADKWTDAEKWILIGIPFLFLIGAAVHFLYDFSNHNFIVGIFAPVNESIWEHSKMAVWPVILWWSFYYLAKKSHEKINKDKWFTSLTVSLILSSISMPFFYYFYTSAFGVQLLAVDILILLFSLSVGQLTALHIYRHSQGVHYKVNILIILAIVLVFAVFTFFTPHLPLFKDGIDGTYGIYIFFQK